MGAIIIKADKKSNRLLSELAKKLGGDVITLADDQFEDFTLGTAMDSTKTGESVDRESILNKLKLNWLYHFVQYSPKPDSASQYID